MKNIREHIYLAALLHDIGKFYQRADTGSVKTSHFLKEHCKEESSFCPMYKGSYSHKHVLWTAQFIDENRAVFQILLREMQGNLSDKNALIQLAAGHHLSEEQLSEYGKIIKKADWLSSGMDRSVDEAMQDDQDENNWDAFKKKRMVPILHTISQKQLNARWHIPIRPLNLSKECFPQEVFNTDPDYGSLWRNFLGEFKAIQAETYHAFAETLLNLLSKYTTCVPASTINFPDVSLYDHLKTTAALAVCLYDIQQADAKQDKPFLLIGADFSGIQSYIYQIVSKYAAKNLKGRSFYLRILSDSVVRYLLKELHLFQANIIYNSGGGFYVIAPNTPYVRDKLAEATKRIEEQLFHAHGTSLFIAIESIEVSENTFMHRDKNLGEIWGELFQKRDRRKSCKFADLITENYDLFFKPTLVGGETQRDSITGEEFLPDEKPYIEENLLLKKNTWEQIRIGKALRASEVMVVSEEKIPYWKDKTVINPADLDRFYYFLCHKDLNEMQQHLRTSADKVSVITLNGKDGNCNFMGITKGLNNIYGLEFYGGNEFNEKTFDEMCGDSNLSRLGVLRMDVDNLGWIFQSGITPERSTLSRYAALSRSFDYFFSGYLNKIRKEVSDDNSFIIYSGGDDLFIIGKWNDTIRIAERIHKDFKEFTCHNPAFSISGGIAVIPPKFPIMKGGEESSKEEKRAKRHSCKGTEKNAISLMSTPLNWEKEFPVVKRLKDEIIRLILLKENPLPKSFISKILLHTANAEIRDHKIYAIKTYWMIAYDLGRMSERSKNEEAIKLINNCKTEVASQGNRLNEISIETNYHPLELWAFACRWAELELRTENDNNTLNEKL